jgi:hypothetical protein
MTAPTLLQPVPQFCDPNGKPYAGGLIGTFVKGTMTPKATWKDPDQAAINTNPITLDGAGECSMWGDGDYRLILYDAAGNLIWDQPATTIVSAAMYPVVSAPTTLDAMNYLGVTTAIAAEATARDAAIAASAASVEADLTIEINNRIAADDDITNYATSAVADLIAVDTSLQTQINLITGTPITYMQSGRATLGAGGSVHIAFPAAFAHSISAVVCTLADTSAVTSGFFGSVTFVALNLTTTGCDVAAYGPGNTAITVPPLASLPTFYWVAIGS